MEKGHIGGDYEKSIEELIGERFKSCAMRLTGYGVQDLLELRI